jgi:hypothetical protein
MTVTVVQSYHAPDEWTVELAQQHQLFRLDYSTTVKSEAEWMARMVSIALARHDKEKLNEQGPLRPRRIRRQAC